LAAIKAFPALILNFTMVSQLGVKQDYALSSRSLFIWRALQTIVWCIGVFILFCLLFYPSIGLLLFWNILIPVAPLLLVLAPGLWRNVCPLATTNLLPRHLNLSKQKKLTFKQSGTLNLIAVVSLYVIVPLRHAIFNNNGPATALLIVTMAIIGVVAGLFYEWKSVWCSGLCPIHPVEKLYGQNVLITVPNAHCDKCMKCVTPCPDSTPNINPASSSKTIYHQITAFLIVGGLPGFIWGWFYVPDETRLTTWKIILNVYKMPLSGLTTTLVIYTLLAFVIKRKYDKRFTAFFAASGVACYYWYRIPALFGFGIFTTDGLLINLKDLVPIWIFPLVTTATTIFFFYWLVLRKPNKKSWLIRPPYAQKPLQVKRKLYA